MCSPREGDAVGFELILGGLLAALAVGLLLTLIALQVSQFLQCPAILGRLAKALVEVRPRSCKIA